jgi:PAS domain S-box-containing protein
MRERERYVEVNRRTAMAQSLDPEATLARLTSSAAHLAEEGLKLLDLLPMAIYVCDAQGHLTHYNEAAAQLWGRRPELGVEKWCGSWRIYDEAGQLLALEDCPMAVTLSEGKPVRDVVIEVHRQDGSRRFVLPNPTPLFDERGQLTGAINVLVDITERREAEAELQRTQNRMRIATSAGKLGVWDWDIAADQVTWSDSLFPIHGIDPEEFDGTVAGFAKLVHPDDLEYVTSAIQEALTSKPNLEMEFRAVRPDGQVLWLYTSAVVERKKGVPVRMSGATMDVTSRATAELERRASEARFRVLASHAPVGIFLTDTDGMCQFVNEMWCDLAGMTPEQAYGRGWEKALHPDDLDRVIAEWYAAAHLRQPFHCEYRFLRPDGVVTWLQGSAIELLEDNGALSGFIGTISDITARKHAEEQLLESDRKKDEYIAMLAHELRNPLGPIRNSVRLLQRQDLVGDAREKVLEIVDRQSRHMARIVDDLLDVSRLTRGKIQLQLQPLDLREVASSTMEDYRQALEERGIRFACTLPKDPVNVQGDATRLSQVVGNLIHNAIKFTEPGGRVALEVGRRSASAFIEVSDTGAGIEAEALPRLFDEFAQGANWGHGSQEGLGLGLALVKGLVALHGGTVTARSEGLGKGSLFRIELPTAEAPVAESPRSSARAAVPRKDRRKILLIEDNLDSAESLRMLLIFGGYQVFVANEGAQALEMLQQCAPEVVICDIGLPNMDGYALCKEMRSALDRPQTRYVALTGYGQERDILRAKEAGFDAHLTKPVEFERLQQVLEARA